MYLQILWQQMLLVGIDTRCWIKHLLEMKQHYWMGFFIVTFTIFFSFGYFLFLFFFSFGDSELLCVLSMQNTRSFFRIAVYIILLTCQKPIQQHKNPPTARDPKHHLCSRGFCGLGQEGRRSLAIKTGLPNGKCNILLLHDHASYCLITM